LYLGSCGQEGDQEQVRVSYGGYLQSLPEHRFLAKNGITKFWKRTATALV
jgi:hypothetical protein